MEIEKAINVLHNCENSARGTSLSTACHMAISALRSQQEREKGCGWCKKYRMEFDCVDDDGNVVAVDNMVLGGGCDYCPVCGRRLKEAQEDGK